MHYCQECGIQLNELESATWGYCGYYECFCSDHAWKAERKFRMYYCKMCGKGIPVSILNTRFGSEDCYCEKCKQESYSYLNTYLYSDSQSKERIAGILFKYNYLTGERVNP